MLHKYLFSYSTGNICLLFRSFIVYVSLVYLNYILNSYFIVSLYLIFSAYILHNFIYMLILINYLYVLSYYLILFYYFLFLLLHLYGSPFVILKLPKHKNRTGFFQYGYYVFVGFMVEVEH